jgi:oligopeptide/dipeptide ABC transporter ATP-binding protein
MVFQDPVASLDPAMRVDRIVGEPLLVHEPKTKVAARAARVEDMLRRVGLAVELRSRFPHELSGGQAQRVAIARALILEPRILICDEAVAALDGTVRGEILRLLDEEQRRGSLSLIMITHDLNVVRQMADRVLVMYLGRVCERASADQIFRRPRHPYTRALIDAMPLANPNAGHAASTIAGEAASVLHPPSGCVFHPRCPHAISACSSEAPKLQAVDNGDVACLRAADLDLVSSQAKNLTRESETAHR